MPSADVERQAVWILFTYTPLVIRIMHVVIVVGAGEKWMLV
jgi:hypothetical protein